MAWLTLPELIFSDIMIMVGLESIECLHRCRQVCKTWNEMIFEALTEYSGQGLCGFLVLWFDPSALNCHYFPSRPDPETAIRYSKETRICAKSRNWRWFFAEGGVVIFDPKSQDIL